MKPQRLSDLTPAMSRALVRCHTMTVTTAEPTARGVRKRTLAALLRHGLIEQGRDSRARPVWRPTARGMVVITTEEPCLLTYAARPRGTVRGYTNDPALAMPDEPEAVDPDCLADLTKQAHARGQVLRGEQQLHREARTLSRRLREETLATGRKGLDVTSELAKIREQLDAIEAKRREAA